MPAALLAQPLADDLSFLDLLRQQHLGWDCRRLVVKLLDKFTQHIRIRQVLSAFQKEVFAPDQLAAADEEDLHAGFAIGARHGDHIRIDVIR